MSAVSNSRVLKRRNHPLRRCETIKIWENLISIFSKNRFFEKRLKPSFSACAITYKSMSQPCFAAHITSEYRAIWLQYQKFEASLFCDRLAKPIETSQECWVRFLQHVGTFSMRSVSSLRFAERLSAWKIDVVHLSIRRISIDPNSVTCVIWSFSTHL